MRILRVGWTERVMNIDVVVWTGIKVTFIIKYRTCWSRLNRQDGIQGKYWRIWLLGKRDSQRSRATWTGNCKALVKNMKYDDL